MSQPKPHVDPAVDPLASLPSHDADVRVAERIRVRGVAAMAFQRRLAQRPWLARVDRLYTRFAEPALVTGAALSYITWAFQAVIGIH